MAGLSHPPLRLVPMSTQLVLLTGDHTGDRVDAHAAPGDDLAAGPGSSQAKPLYRLDRRTIEDGRRGVAAARAALEAANERVRQREDARRAARDAELARRAAERRRAA
jgi:hypothetical protein